MSRRFGMKNFSLDLFELTELSGSNDVGDTQGHQC